MPKLSQINIYPIKSCKGISVQSIALSESGLAYDRAWMIVADGTGKFLTQRQRPQLALVEVSIPAEVLLGAGSHPDAVLTINAPGQAVITVPLQRLDVVQADMRQVKVWDWSGEGMDEGDEVAQWFTAYLGTPVRLVRYLGRKEGVSDNIRLDEPTSAVRGIDDKWAVGYETRFSDGYPMLLATEAALADLNSKLAEPLPMNRFRPNLVVSGTEAWAEDSWRRIAIKGQEEAAAPALELVSCKPCSRCKMTTVDQATGTFAGDEPLDSLAEFRSGKLLGWNVAQKSWTHDVFFGWNMVCKAIRCCQRGG
ncbi:MAG: hypothetical protein WDW38_001107 [Sanguina aurantia]